MEDKNLITWSDNYNFFKTFYTKEVKIMNNINDNILYFHIPEIKEIFEEDGVIYALSFFEKPLKEVQDIFSSWNVKSHFDLINLFCFVFRKFKELEPLRDSIWQLLYLILPKDKNKYNIDLKEHRLTINNIVIDETVWERIMYLIQRSFNEEEGKKQFQSLQEQQNLTPEQKAFYQKQKEIEERIRKIKQSGTKGREDDEEFLKFFITIQYAFPSLNFDFLFSCSYAQVGWLYKYAINACNYDMQVQVMAAGHMDSKHKFKFFTEN